MNAIELAEYLEDYSEYERATDIEAADMLRKQHAAIVKLRSAIEESQSLAMWKYTGCGIRNKLEQALADTEEIAK